METGPDGRGGVPRGALADLVTTGYPDVRLADMVLAAGTRAGLDRVLHEQRQRELLAAHGLAPVRRLLLTGPAGTGKSMAAAAVATELTLALVTVRLDALTSAYAGERATKLRVVYDALAGPRSVCLLAGLDAIEARRVNGHDLGEALRIVDMLLSFVDVAQPESLVVAAVKHGAMLDDALLRRFDAVIGCALPDAAQGLDLLRRSLGAVNTSAVSWDEVGGHVTGLSHAGLARAAASAAKRAVLDQAESVSTRGLVAALAEVRGIHSVVGFGIAAYVAYEQ